MYINRTTMKRKYILLIVAFIVLLVLCVMGNLITIGDKVYSVSSVLGYIYYTVITTLVSILIVIPALRVILTPEYKGNECLSEETIRELKDTIKESAKVSFMMTSVCQNGSIDALANTAISFKMMGSIVSKAGIRPSLPQLFRLYSSVITTSLIVSSVDEVLDNLDISSLIGNAGVGVACKILQPITNGAANAYTCLRMGYATLRYLQVGENEYRKSKSEIRRMVAKQARQEILPVIKSEVKDIIARAK